MADQEKAASEAAFVKRLAWDDEELGSIPLPKGAMPIRSSFGSGLGCRAGDPAGIIWGVGDRGPNVKLETLRDLYGVEGLAEAEAKGAKIMPRLDLGPAIAKLRLHDDRVELLEVHRVTDSSGRPMSGVPIPGGEHARREPAFDLAGAALPPDVSGLDTEGIACRADGSSWVGDEFGPSLVQLSAKGEVLARHLPQGVELPGAPYPVRHTLPALAARRHINRGFEALALSEDERWLFLAFQSPLAHPDEAAHESARHVRLWQLDADTWSVHAQYLYPFEPPTAFRRDNQAGGLGWSDLKVSELLALDGDSLLILERASASTKLFRVELRTELAVGPEHLDPATRPTLEELSGRGDALPSLAKRLVFDTDAHPEVSPDLEGMVLLSPTELLLVSDNDFGVEGAHTSFWKVTLATPLR